MYRRKKLLTVVISLAVIFVALFSNESLSYYAVTGEATNVVTTGDVSICVIEKMGDTEFPSEVSITPGQVISKKVSVKNIGSNSCWLRIKLTDGIEGKSLTDGIYELDINDEDWIDGEDGYYYYKSVLKPDAETEKLFTQVKISGEKTDNSYIGKTLKLTVTAYAVQSEHMEADSPLEVVGWPEES